MRGWQRNVRSAAFAVTAFTASAIASSCSGGGSIPTSAGGSSGPGSQGSGAATDAQVRVTIAWPKPGASSAVRRREYVSNSTASVTIAVDGGAKLVVNNPNLTPGTGATQSTTVVDVDAPVGSDTFAVDDYDKIGGAGNLLAANSVPLTVVKDAANTLSITLNGNLAKLACAAVGPLVTGSGPFTLVGPAGQLKVLPEDADGNIIVAPGVIPQTNLTPVVAGQATVTQTKTENEFTVAPAGAGTAVTLNATGENLAGAAVPATTCSITRELALYVVNNDSYGSSQSVTIYPVSASGNATPIATLAGANTMLVQPHYIAVDAGGNIFVSNIGPKPGSTFGPQSGYVTVYSAGAGESGNQAPIATIPNLDTPQGLAFDSKGDLYELSIDRINIFPPTADGVTGSPAISSVIAGPTPGPGATTNNTDLYSCYGMRVDATGKAYAACSDVIDVFAAGATGNATPTLIEAPGMTTMSDDSFSWLDVAADSSGRIYAPASNDNLNLVTVYAAGASGAATPTLAKSTGFSQPIGLAIDPNNQIYVTDYDNDSVQIFSSETTLVTGLGTTISGSSTGLAGPWGVAVR